MPVKVSFDFGDLYEMFNDLEMLYKDAENTHEIDKVKLLFVDTKGITDEIKKRLEAFQKIIGHKKVSVQ